MNLADMNGTTGSVNSGTGASARRALTLRRTGTPRTRGAAGPPPQRKTTDAIPLDLHPTRLARQDEALDQIGPVHQVEQKLEHGVPPSTGETGTGTAPALRAGDGPHDHSAFRFACFSLAPFPVWERLPASRGRSLPGPEAPGAMCFARVPGRAGEAAG